MGCSRYASYVVDRSDAQGDLVGKTEGEEGLVSPRRI